MAVARKDDPGGSTPNRSRLVLVAGADSGHDASHVSAALAAGDIASLILVQGKTDESAFQAWAENLVGDAQAHNIAAIVAGDTRVAGRIGADGIHLESGPAELADAVKRHAGRLIVGAGGAKTRHDALDLGEAQPDYVFFGRFGYDIEAEPHPRNLDLASWWAEIIQVPCIVQAGSSLESIVAAAATGAEFVAVGAAILGEGVDAPEAVRRANALLDEHAPRFED